MGRKLEHTSGSVDDLRSVVGAPGDVKAVNLAGNVGLRAPSEAKALAQLFTTLPRLQELNASSCGLGGDEVQELAQGLRCLAELEHLALGCNHFGAVGAVALADEVLPHLPALRKLALTGCRLGGVALRHLARGLRRLPTLEALHLGGNTFEAEGMRAFAEEVLPSLKNLRHLDLTAFVRLDADVAAVLAAGLRHTASLQELDLGNSGIGTASMRALAPALGCLTKLERLKLRNSDLGVAGARALAEEALPHMAALTELDLSRCGLEAAPAVELSLGLLHLVRLERLFLEGNEFGTDGARALASAAFPHLKDLKELDLSDCALKAEATKELAPALQLLRHLRVLHFRGNQFGTDGAIVLSTEALAHLLELQVLDLRGCDLTRPATEALAPGVSQMANLETLDFGERKVMGHFVRALTFGREEWTPKFRKLKSLDLEGSGLGSTFLIKLIPSFQYLPDLETVNFKNNDFGANGLEVLASEGLPRLVRVRDLNLTDCNIGSAGMQVLAPNVGKLTELEKLSLRGNEFHEGGAQALSELAFPHLAKLKELVLAHCELDAAAMKVLAPGLGQLRGLEKLVVAFNEFEEAGLEALVSETLPRLTFLKELNLCSCGLTGAQVAQHLTQGFQHVTGLEKLVLTSNDLGDEGAQGLAAEGALVVLKELRELEFGHAFIEGESMQELAPVLATLTNLERLVVLGNNFGTAGAKSITNALPPLQKLKELNLSYGGLDAAAMEELAPALKTLHNLESLSLRNNKFGKGGVQALAEKTLPHLKKLSFLDLRLCGLLEETMELLAPSISQLCLLKALELGDKKLLIAFVTALATCTGDQRVQLTSWQELAFDKCDLTGEIVHKMVPGIRLLSGLKALSLRGNEGMGIEGARALAAVLPALPRMRELHLANCSFGADAMQELAPVLAQLLDLEVLNLMNNTMEDDGATVLNSIVLPRLLCLRELNVLGCSFSDEAKNTTAAARCPGAGVVG